MNGRPVPDDFYEVAKPRLYGRIGRELRVARHVLDIGCGACELTEFLARGYHQDVTGVDVSSESFPRRARCTTSGRVRCVCRDARQLDFIKDEKIDAVVTMWALHEMTYPLEILSEAWRVLRPGGEILIVDFPRDSLAQRLWNETYCRPDELAEMLRETHFSLIRSRAIERGQILWAKGYRPEAIADRKRPAAPSAEKRLTKT